MKIAITGHRPNKLGNDYDLTSDLILKIREKLQHIITENNIPGNNLEIITGMALGIDTLWALLAIENRVLFTAAIPCKAQWSQWPQKSRDRYNEIINHWLCTIHMVSDRTYFDGCMQKRNEWMVDNCDLLIAVWDGTDGGTANCLKYAKKKGRKIVFINPKEIEYAS